MNCPCSTRMVDTLQQIFTYSKPIKAMYLCKPYLTFITITRRYTILIYTNTYICKTTAKISLEGSTLQPKMDHSLCLQHVTIYTLLAPVDCLEPCSRVWTLSRMLRPCSKTWVHWIQSQTARYHVAGLVEKMQLRNVLLSCDLETAREINCIDSLVCFLYGLVHWKLQHRELSNQAKSS